MNCIEIESEKEYLFSIVVAVYNSEKYLREAIESVISQTLDFVENVQLILINDGSKDGSLDICQEYQSQYPNNIIVINQENKGVSCARNAGVACATGRYINFLDSDDYFSDNALQTVADFFARYENDLDVVTIRTELCGEKQGDSWFNRKFDKGSRVIDLGKEPQVYLNATNTSFFHKRIKNQLYFDEKMTIAEDLKVVNTVLSNKWRLGVISDALYFYRIHDGSLVDKAKLKKNYYIPYLKNIFFWFYDKSMKQWGFFPEFLQYTLFRDLFNRFNNNKEVLSVLDGKEYAEYKRLLIKAIRCIDSKIIQHNSFCNSDQQIYFLALQNGRPEIKSENDVCVYQWGDINVKKKPFYCINHLDFKDKKIIVEGYFVINNVFAEDVEIYAKNEKDSYEKIVPFVTPHFDSYAFGNEVMFYRRHFRYERYVGDENVLIDFYFRIEGKMIPFLCLAQGQWSPFNTMETSYYYKNGYIAIMNGVQIKAKRIGWLRHFAYQKKYMDELREKAKTNVVAKHSYLMRLLYNALNWIYSLKNIWIVSDRHVAAGDNGEALFRYLMKKKSGVTAYFAIDGEKSNSIDLPKSKVVSFDTKKYKWYFLFAKAIVSSHFDRQEMFFTDHTYIKDIVAKKSYVFLQHGITKDDVSSFYNRDNQNINLLITSTHAEYASIVENDGYLLGKEHTALLGMPRYDLLLDNKKRMVVIAPTWRQGTVRFRGNESPIVANDFTDSAYYQFYHSLMNDPRLQDVAKKNGYEIVYFPHFNMMATNDYFEDIANIKLIKEGREYKKFFSEAALWVTDYSSTAFDFAYLGKPVVYCQSDKKEFFGSHTYTEGYFDYEKDGFGEVVYDIDSAVLTICEYIKNGCAMKEKYLERINNTFAYRDRSNALRVVEAIKEIINEK